MTNTGLLDPPAAPTNTTAANRLAPLAVAELAVLLGGQAWFVTLTWLLVDRGTPGSTIGMVLMIGALPRAVLMLLGGAVTDRFNPVTVLRTAAGAQVALMSAAIVGASSGEIATWHLGVLAGLFGAVDAFFFPAVGALIPQLVPPQHRNRANAFIQLCDQVTQIAGPVMAGVLLARTGETPTFAVILACFGVGLVALLVMRAGRRTRPSPAETLSGAIAEAVRFAWRTPDVRLCLIVAAALSLGTVGPVSVGGALLADQRLGGAQSLGVLLGLFGVGAFIGVVIAGTTKPPRSSTWLLAVTTAGIGIGVALLGTVNTLTWAGVVAVPTGVAAGYLGVVATTLLQNHTPDAMQGRVSSLLMFAFFALDPVSQGLSGLLVDLGVSALFSIAGIGLVAVGVVIAFLPKGP